LNERRRAGARHLHSGHEEGLRAGEQRPGMSRRASLRRILRTLASGEAALARQSVGPQNPISTPRGARTVATRTPSITVSGAFTDSAPAATAALCAASAFSTCTVGVDPGASPGAVGRIPPPPDSE